MTLDTSLTRKNAREFALRVYSELKHSRPYALNDEAIMRLSALAYAVAQYRRERGDFRDDELFDAKPFNHLIHRLAEAGCNLLQERPTDEKPLPKPWVNPITGQPLSLPKGPDERATLQRLDPNLLEWFDNLEKAPYRTVAAYRAAEAERQALGVIPYREAEHKNNPFRGTNETSKAHLAKRDPTLAAFYQREAMPVSLNVFGENQNMTLRSRLEKDPYLATIARVAESTFERWRNEDRESAQAQRAAADATLKRLEVA
jgi:hypothetical protein